MFSTRVLHKVAPPHVPRSRVHSTPCKPSGPTRHNNIRHVVYASRSAPSNGSNADYDVTPPQRVVSTADLSAAAFDAPCSAAAASCSSSLQEAQQPQQNVAATSGRSARGGTASRGTGKPSASKLGRKLRKRRLVAFWPLLTQVAGIRCRMQPLRKAVFTQLTWLNITLLRKMLAGVAPQLGIRKSSVRAMPRDEVLRLLRRWWNKCWRSAVQPIVTQAVGAYPHADVVAAVLAAGAGAELAAVVARTVCEETALDLRVLAAATHFWLTSGGRAHAPGGGRFIRMQLLVLARRLAHALDGVERGPRSRGLSKLPRQPLRQLVEDMARECSPAQLRKAATTPLLGPTPSARDPIPAKPARRCTPAESAPESHTSNQTLGADAEAGSKQQVQELLDTVLSDRSVGWNTAKKKSVVVILKCDL